MFFLHRGRETRRIYFRINAQAVRFQQGGKEYVTDTMGGFYRDVFYSSNPAHNGLLIPDITIEGTTGVAYRAELERMKWVFRHKADRKSDGSPADTYFYDLIEVGEYQRVVRDVQRAWLISLQNFAFDESVQNPNEIKFTFRCKLLEDLLGQLDPEPPPEATGTLPNLTDFDPNLSNPIDTTQITGFSTTALPI